MMLSPLAAHVAPAAVVALEGEAINHWVVGAIALAILLFLLGGLVLFGGGREHS